MITQVAIEPYAIELPATYTLDLTAWVEAALRATDDLNAGVLDDPNGGLYGREAAAPARAGRHG
jgi:hypothetical protein